MSKRRTTVHASVMAVVTAVLVAGFVTPVAAGASAGHGASPARATVGTHYAKISAACGEAKLGKSSCFALRRVNASASTPGAKPYNVSAAYPVGPGGGFTPADLATAYGFNPDATAAATQTVGIVDAYNDPNARADLNHFNEQYGLPDETATSLKIVGQTGSTASLPANDTTGWSEEESLDLDAVRGVCHLCKIVLVETDSNSNANLRDGVAAAHALGATEISNSYGGSEGAGESAAAQAADIAAYNFPGVVVTASTGDNGWGDWDYMNNNYYIVPTPEVPSSLPDVVAVGGTSLFLNADGTRHSETVWNRNGLYDATGYANSLREGATGGGCSTLYTAPAWQSSVAGFSSTGCGTNRLAADVSAIADPYTGYDIYDTWNGGDGVYNWATFGGTSLASPVIAAMWALNGGAGAGVSYPATSLYAHFHSTASSLYDVTQGGNSYCGGGVPATCASNGPLHNVSGGTTNPNGTGYRTVDCSFAPWPSTSGTVNTNDTQCNATTGYDGPSGVGTPNGLTALTAVTPSASVTKPATIKLHQPASFKGVGTGDGIPGESISSYTWSWGDGTTSTGATASHAYAKAGTYTVHFAAIDNFSSAGTAVASVTVGVKPKVTASGPATLKAKKKGTFKASATDSNTGGTIASYAWSFGDGKSASGTKVTHKFKKTGKYKVKVKVTDNEGNSTTKKVVVQVH